MLSFVLTIAFTFTFVIPDAQASQVTPYDLFKSAVKNLMRGDYEIAVENLTEAIALKNDFGAAYSNRCLAYLQLQDYHNAIADCTQAINFVPNNAEAYLNRGLAHYRQGNYQAAIADDIKAIALQGDDFRAYYNRGVARAAGGNFLEAIADYNLALSQIPQTNTFPVADIYNDRGLAHLELANLQTAMLDFDMAIRLNANDDRAYFNRGCACTRSGNIKGAEHDFSEVIRINPSNALAYVNRGVARHQLGYHQSAIADLNKAAEFFGHQGERIAYQKTLDLLKNLQQQIPSEIEISLL